jgi:hypothetical protein
MSAVEVMDLVKRLPEREAMNLGRMLDDWLAGIVDRKFEVAVPAGSFDAMAADALREAEEGKTIPLDNFTAFVSTISAALAVDEPPPHSPHSLPPA